MKRYLALSLKKKIPLFVIITVTFLAIAIITSSDVYFIEMKCNGYYARGLDTIELPVFITFLFIFITILPLFGMNYRYSIAKSDTFRQAPFLQKRLRWIDQLPLLIVTLIAFSVAFCTYVGILVFRNYTVHVPMNFQDQDHEIYYEFFKVYLHYEYFIPLYFVSILLAILQYAISYLFVSRSNNLLNSIIVLICGEMFLGFYLYVLSGFSGYHYYDYGIMAQSSFILPCVFLTNVFEGKIIEGDKYSFYKNYFYNHVENMAFALAIAIIAFVIIAILGILAFFLEKDPSSEWAGKPEDPKPYQEIIYHLGFGFGGAFLFINIGTSALLLTYVLSFVLVSALYYTLYGTLHRNFKLKTHQWGAIIGVVIFMLFMGSAIPNIFAFIFHPYI